MRLLLDELRLTFVASLSLVSVLMVTPMAIAFARRVGFFDRPLGYKGHAAPTPYLGGAAVMTGFLAGAAAAGVPMRLQASLTACTLLLWALGTVDDRVGLGPLVRVVAEVAAAGLLWASGFGWSVFPGEAANLLLTVAWVVAVVNALNLMDNMDGAAGTVAAVSAGGMAVLALIGGDPALAGVAMALCAACLGFLPFNLAAPSRIFLGDGGSMPIGFALAALAMILPMDPLAGWSAMLVAVFLVGLPVLDTSLVIVSRRRRGAPVLSGGRDHLTHRLRGRFGSARAVAGTLAVGQAALSTCAIAVSQLGQAAVLGVSLLSLLLGAGLVVMLETSTWMPSTERSSSWS